MLSLILEDGCTFRFFHSSLVSALTKMDFDYIHFIASRQKNVPLWSIVWKKCYKKISAGLRGKMVERAIHLYINHLDKCVLSASSSVVVCGTDKM